MGLIIAALVALFGVYSDVVIQQDKTDSKIAHYEMHKPGGKLWK